MRAISENQADLIYTDEVAFRRSPRKAGIPSYKPDFSPDLLRSMNYIGHFLVFSRALLARAGGVCGEFDRSCTYDLTLRLSEAAQTIAHVPSVLYLHREDGSPPCADMENRACDAAKAVLNQHLQRVGLDGTAEDSAAPFTYRIRYAIGGEPLVSILIPNKDHTPDLIQCIDSVLAATTYRNYEIIIIENNSTQQETFDCYASLCANHANVRLARWDGPFNYSAINNFGFRFARGEYILLLNNDTQVISPDWLQEMLMFAQRKDVGAVGAKLYYPNDTVQHAGVIMDGCSAAGHAYSGFRQSESGYMDRLSVAQNLSVVTGACLMLPRRVFNEVGGLDEQFAVALNDVDLCLRIRSSGYRIVLTPYAELYHCESKSRGYEDTDEKRSRLADESNRLRQRWAAQTQAGDPYYNPKGAHTIAHFLQR